METKAGEFVHLFISPSVYLNKYVFIEELLCISHFLGNKEYHML